MNSIVFNECLFDLLNSLICHEGVHFPYPLKIVFENPLVYMQYENSARLSDASSTLFELGIPHRVLVK